MKDEISQLVLILLSVVVAAGLEELLPSFAGVGFPLLLSLVLVASPRVNVLPGVMLAIGAGAFEDALSSLPPLVSICFFVVAALLSRKSLVPRPFLALAYPVYVFWIGMCSFGPTGDLFMRVLVAVPVGAVALLATALGWEWSGRKAGFRGK